MIVVWLFLSWFLAGIGRNAYRTHRDVDLRRCYIDPVEQQRVCWPQRGCWMDTPDRVMCWQVQKLQAGKPRRAPTP